MYGRRRTALLLLALVGALAAPRVAAQESSLVDESATEAELLREASILESAGELRQAERLLGRILTDRPASVPALLALERMLRIQARLEDLVQPVTAALEEEPRSALLNKILVRTYSALDRVGDLEAAGARWIREVPELEIPYRELAEVWVERGDLERARAVLEQGRRDIEADDALALELGDLYAADGALERAVQEWERAVGPEARGLSQVRRRLRSLPDGGASVIPELVRLLTGQSASTARLRAAVGLAVDAGLEEQAEAVAARVLSAVPTEERSSFLIEVARRADGARLHRLAFWAYESLAEAGSDDAGRLLAVRNRLAELALELGDTATAAANYRAVEAAFEQGTPQRRQAAALRIELMAGQAVDSAGAALREFRAEYADAPELDRLASTVARGLLAQDRPDDATAVLAGVRGPEAALLRGRIALDDGAVEEARTAFMAAAGRLRGAEATRVLGLITLLGRVSDASGRVIGAALQQVDAGEVGAAVDRLEADVPRLPAEDRPALLELAAVLADGGGLVDDARRVRRRLLEEYPRSGEAPAALLELARGLRTETDGGPEARELLERLIVEYPRSALVPQARRELQQITRGDTGDAQTQGNR